MSKWWLVIIVGLPAAHGLAQGFDDPRVADYAALISGVQQMEQKILTKRARFCAAGLTDYCGPPPFVPQMSVEEFRARLAK